MSTVVDIQDKIPELVKKKRRRLNRRFYTFVVIILLLLLTLIYFQTSLSDVKEVDVYGASLAEPIEYVEESGIRMGDSIWGLKLNEIERQLLKMPTVKAVEVSRSWNRIVSLKIQEKMPVAYIETEGLFQLMLEDGTELPYVHNQMTRKIPIISRFETLEQKQQIAAQLLQIEDAVFELISEIIIAPTDYELKVRLYMDDGNEVHTLMNNLAERLTYYPQLVTQLGPEEKGVFDLEVGAYFTSYDKLYGGSDNDEQQEEEIEEE